MSEQASLSKSKFQVGLIGVGVMGEALISGLVSSRFPKAQIVFTEKRADRAREISSKYGAREVDLTELAKSSDVILLVVKPQDLEQLLVSIGADLNKSATLVSFAAGKTTDFVSEIVGSNISIIRVMPNTPTLIGLGMAAISLGKSVNTEQAQFVSAFLATCGKVISIEEKLQDAVTALSGSGPAYFFAFVEEMIKSGISLGLSKDQATTLAIQTMAGSAAMLEQSGKSATTLRENVTSPNGTTAAALKVFSEANLGEIVTRAMTAARDRSQELA
ncbi:MAG: pyrroline-5-carboxylate reductase [Actinobacteria bacterium]|jgi:pyrroline-5-carboxylate reductase|nr:pyrroline-5-carboxylate reductase [Actinomycetota bacterium]MDA2981541.1 pyrroline-5-carboxylate reductase [Actinomycetota bacterium]MDA2995916.1 pyrroline-5-carboxylate reductase [Actinomycetota bacterium]